MLERMARTVRGYQPALNGTWQACIPRSPRQPYSPLISTIRFQLIGLCGVEVRGVQEAGVDLDDLPERLLLDHAARVAAWPGRTGSGRCSGRRRRGCRRIASYDGVVGRLVDPERLFAQEVFAGGDDVGVERLVQVVRHGAVDGVDVGIGQQLRGSRW